MLHQQAEYFLIDEVFKVPIGLSIFGHSPRPDAPWPQPGEVVEMCSPDGSSIQALILKIDESMAQIPGANPATRAVLIPRDSAQGLSLEGFRVTACRNPSTVMLQQQIDYQSAAARSRRIPIALIWLFAAIMAIAAAMLYRLR